MVLVAKTTNNKIIRKLGMSTLKIHECMIKISSIEILICKLTVLMILVIVKLSSYIGASQFQNDTIYFYPTLLLFKG